MGGDASGAAVAGRRMRRSSGVPSVSGGSPKQHRRSANEETWHMTVCSHYIQEYIPYLQSLGFTAIQTKHTASRKSRCAGFFQKGRLGLKNGSLS